MTLDKVYTVWYQADYAVNSKSPATAFTGTLYRDAPTWIVLKSRDDSNPYGERYDTLEKFRIVGYTELVLN